MSGAAEPASTRSDRCEALLGQEVEMTAEPVYVGIDVAKDAIVLAVVPSGERWTSATDGPALEQVVARVAALAPAHAGPPRQAHRPPARGSVANDLGPDG